VLARINEKLRYRHPHVFGDVTVRDSDEVVDNWEQLKLLEPEQTHRTSALDGVPDILPALKRAFALQKKASKVGFDWPDVAGPRAKVREEEAELEEALAAGDRDRVADEFGDLLFALVNMARFYRLDPEDALRRTCDRFAERFTRVERQANEAGRDLRGMDITELDALWEKAKEEG
jgi:tetrapyrrole methylase family protein/MazG family protein